MLSNYYDGGDQGLLNQFFSDWASQDIGRHLPFIYNMCSSATYSYLPAYKHTACYYPFRFGELVKIVHFIGPNKPWLLHFDTETRQVRPPPDSLRYLPLPEDSVSIEHTINVDDDLDKVDCVIEDDSIDELESCDTREEKSSSLPNPINPKRRRLAK
uniref:Uncharacterized protein n=1 Tax=Timema bartmani TaxID=61472 RepID=A0A7R9ELQ4_9NEOP|nr:unnamed protein product [Timema bartmani]